MNWLRRLCVDLGLIEARHHRPHPHPRPFNLEDYVMTLSAKAQALADELAGLPALIAADKTAANAGIQAQADEDLDGLKPFVDAVAASVVPAPAV